MPAKPSTGVYRMALAGIALASVVVVLGAYTRLVDAGLGCPDWPGCYGQLGVPTGAAEIARAEAAFPDAPVEADKAWVEMIHRYAATTLGALILVILGLGTAGFGTMQATITMLVSSEEMRGRALGVISLAIGVGPLGAVITGAVASAYGAPFAIGLNAAIGLALLIAVGVLMPSLLRPTVLSTQPQAETVQTAPATPRG